MALFVSPVVPPVPPALPAPRPAVATQRVPSDATGKQTLVRKRVADMTCGHEPKSWEIIVLQQFIGFMGWICLDSLSLCMPEDVNVCYC